MGNEFSSGPNRLALGALCHVLKFDRAELLQLQKECGRITSRAPESLITKDQFQMALQAVGFADADKEVLNRVFILLDRGAEYKINYRELLSGMGTTVRGTFREKLAFAFELYDVDDVKKVSREETLFITRAINRHIPFFGDEPLDDAKLHAAVEEVFVSGDGEKLGSLPLATVSSSLSDNATLVTFVSSVPDRN